MLRQETIQISFLGITAIIDDGIPVSSAFPSRGRCPEGADRAQAAGKTDGESGEVAAHMGNP